MNFVSLKNAFVAAAFLFAVGHTDMTPAHTLSGALGLKAKEVDLYQVICFAEGGLATHRLRMRLRDNFPEKEALVSVQSLKELIATQRTDATDGNATYSNWISNFGGDGVYHVLVNKSSSGAEIYTLEFHCESATGVHTGTDAVQLQNQ